MWRRGSRAYGAKVRVALAAGIRRALGARHGIHLMYNLLLMLHAARAQMLDATAALAPSRRRALAVVATFAAQRLVGGRRRGAAAAVAVVDVVFHVLVDLLEKEGALEAHLLDAAVQAGDA